MPSPKVRPKGASKPTRPNRATKASDDWVERHGGEWLHGTSHHLASYSEDAFCGALDLEEKEGPGRFAYRCRVCGTRLLLDLDLSRC